jgi:agmatine deiminase
MNANETSTPARHGYRMPAEWEPHAATWVAWPHNPDTWPNKFAPLPGIWAAFIRTLARYEPVRVLAGGGDVLHQAQRLVGNWPNVTIYDVPTNDLWIRDYGPTFLVGPTESPAALVDWGYNAWGGKYPPFDLDNRVPESLCWLLGRRRFSPGIVLEGGAIDVNGMGAVLTTEDCLLNANRNPDMTRQRMEGYLAEYLAARHVIWLRGGMAGDDTDGHVDQMARFVAPDVVVAAFEPDPTEANHQPLQENLSRLRTARLPDGRPLNVHPLTMPRRPLFEQGQRLPASYLNFYIANGAVIVPLFADEADDDALSVLSGLFPDRRVVGIHAVDLVWGLGAFHCATQQEPRPPASSG